ncbi:UNVERIFIED_CONTAM: hypothetical protein GTU68_012635 [Idotea baltica]|nr:hypothetical protein [Idotea baltica]
MSASDAPQYAIDAQDLRKTYAAQGIVDAKEALKGISLQVPAGSIFGLLGPNGAGKSTFINILAGLVRKSSGSVSIWGFDQDENPRMSRASIGVVPQELLLDPFFTPREAMEIQAGMYGVPKRDRHTMELLEALGLGDKADAPARSLSGGMRRRLLIGKALSHSPPVLILDEPTAGVDIELRKHLWEYVQELNERGVTVVLTTHYLEEAEEMCDRIAIINHGEVVVCEDTPELLSRVDAKILSIQPETALTEVPAALAERGDIEARIRPDGMLVITYPKSKMQLGIIVKDLSTEEADLEEVFVALTSN